MRQMRKLPGLAATHIKFTIEALEPRRLLSAAGDIDTGYAGAGIAFNQFLGDPGPIVIGHSAIQPDGKLIEIGSSADGPGVGIVSRLNADGSVDRSFGQNGIAQIDVGAWNELARAALVQPDGKILIVGGAVSESAGLASHESFLISRLNANGTLDSTFGTGGSTLVQMPDQIHGDFDHVAILSDGRIIAGGSFQTTDGDLMPAVARFSSSGVFESDFGIKTIEIAGINPSLGALAIAGDRVLIGASVTTANGELDSLVIRLDQDGNYDSSFGSSGTSIFDAGGSDSVTALTVDSSSGAIYVGSGNGADALLTRLTPDGQVDATYGLSGTARVSLPPGTDGRLDTIRDEQGNFVWAGVNQSSAGTDSIMVLRMTPAGQLDGGFGSAGIQFIPVGLANFGPIDIHSAPDGRLAVTTSHADESNNTQWISAEVLDRAFSSPHIPSRDFRLTPDTVIQIMFPGDVLASADMTDLVGYNRTTGEQIRFWSFTKVKTGLGDTVLDWMQTTALPEGDYLMTVPAGALKSSAGFELGAYTFELFVASSSYVHDTNLIRMADPSHIQITRTVENGAPSTFLLPADLFNMVIWIDGGRAGDTTTLDFSNGDIALAAGVFHLDGGYAGTLQILGRAPDDAFKIGSYGLGHPSLGPAVSHFLDLQLANGTFTFNGSFTSNITVASSATAVFNSSLSVTDLEILGAGKITAGNSKVLRVGTLTVAPWAKLDLSDNDLIVASTPIGSWRVPGAAYDGIMGMLADGLIYSSSAQDGYTTLGVATAGDMLGITGSQTGTFDGQTVYSKNVVVKYTYEGDANLDGMVNIDDYGRIDANVGQSGTVFGWYFGDFNLDGLINVDDYGLIDGVIGRQGQVL